MLPIPERPEETIISLMSLVQGMGKRELIKPGVIIPNDGPDITIFYQGEAELRRKSDDLLLFSSENRQLIGLPMSETFQRFCYLRTNSVCDIELVERNAFYQAVEKEHCWLDVIAVLSYYHAVFLWRDSYAHTKSSYLVVRHLLFQLNQLPEEKRYSINIAEFIQERTNLSRSYIMKVLSDLKTGGYITLKKGRLIKLNHLPAKY
ncbi:helix-turn-helix domain-containing protein [Limnobaculum xujianqingii]|uniref:helix-turn-helix domain-containing protein n=1 Tax=Limnobaculum xujianqingii TaxID=2738837 RepID=UPI0011274B6D|nr:helix-turn-helix domain-containing protein [Limnobaculum xujianqingii]